MQDLPPTATSSPTGAPTSLRSRVCPGRPARLVVTGEIDLATRDDFERAVAEAASRHRRLVIDLTGVEFMSSVGIGTLYAHLDSCAAVIVNEQDMVARALRMVGFPRLVVAPPVRADTRPRQ